MRSRSIEQCPETGARRQRTTGTVDLFTLRAALETSDAPTLIGLYADDAELQVMDRLHQPSNPLVDRGKDAIAGYGNTLCAREMTHVT